MPGPNKKCIWLFNHRSWADFFIDHLLTGYQAAYLSRLMVFVAAPLVGLAGTTGDFIWFFRAPSKGRPLDRDKFNAFLDRKLRTTKWRGLIVYPEATRNHKDSSLPLRTGVIRYAYSRKLVVQIAIGANKELVLNEQGWRSQHGVTVHVAYSQVIDPADFATDDEFVAEVQRTWDRVWAFVHRKTHEHDQRRSSATTTNNATKASAISSGAPGTTEAKKREAAEAAGEPPRSEDDQSVDPYAPPYVPKSAGLRTGKTQVCFIFGLVTAYAAAGLFVWLLVFGRVF